MFLSLVIKDRTFYIAALYTYSSKIAGHLSRPCWGILHLRVGQMAPQHVCFLSLQLNTTVWYVCSYFVFNIISFSTWFIVFVCFAALLRAITYFEKLDISSLFSLFMFYLLIRVLFNSISLNFFDYVEIIMRMVEYCVVQLRFTFYRKICLKTLELFQNLKFFHICFI